MVKTFDIISAVIYAKADEISDNYKVNPESMRILEQYCTAIDDIVKECNVNQITGDVIDGNKVVISIVSSYFVCQTEQMYTAYYGLIERAIEFNVTNVNKGDIQLEFVFPTVFSKI